MSATNTFPFARKRHDDIWRSSFQSLWLRGSTNTFSTILQRGWRDAVVTKRGVKWSWRTFVRTPHRNRVSG
jgi:hypothetical protein